MQKLSWIFLGLWLCFQQNIYAQALRFHRYTIDDGLAYFGTYQPYSTTQDTEGFLWFTSFHGLTRFDGRTFKVYQKEGTKPNALGQNFTTTIATASDGKIWAGTADKGIFVMNPVTEQFEWLRHDPNNANTPCGDAPFFLKKDSDGNMWLGTRFSGVCRYCPKEDKWDNFSNYFKDGSSFFQDAKGQIWVGNRAGLRRFLADTKSFEFIEGTADGAFDISAFSNEELLLKGKSGLYILHTATLKVTPFQTAPPLSRPPNNLFTDREGTIWMGVGNQLWRYHPTNKSFQAYQNDLEDAYSVPPGPILFPYQDKSGSIWFMTPGEGVFVTHFTNNPFQQCGDLYTKRVHFLDDNHLLVTDGGTFKAFDLETKQLTTEGLPNWFSAIPMDIYIKKKDELWMRYWDDGIFKIYNLATQTLKEVPITRGPLAVDKWGKVWSRFKYFDTLAGQWIDQYATIKANFPELLDNPSDVKDIFFDSQNRLWVSSGKGIFRYNFDTKEGKYYGIGKKGEPASLTTVYFFPGYEGRFYVFNEIGFSAYLSDEEGFVNFGKQEGLLHNSIGGILEDSKGNVWIGTALGLQKLDVETRTFTNYDVEDGLPANRFYRQDFYEDKNGWIYFGTDGKLVRFHPDSLRTFEASAPVHLLDFFLSNTIVEPSDTAVLGNKLLRFGKSIPLNYKQSDFGFSFVMPFFYKPDKVDYFYKLEPYETEWINNGNDNEVQYTNIDPGTYTFRVKARTASGIWSEQEATISIHIAPPWWETWWAYLLYGIVLLTIILGIYRFNLVRQLAKAEAERLKEIDTLKSRLYTNITHEFRTPLTIIMGMSYSIKGHDMQRQLIHRNSKNLLRLINQLLDLSKLDNHVLKLEVIQADIVPYLRYLTQSFFSMAESRKIGLKFESYPSEIIMDFDESSIQHILYNLLSNALKFTPAGELVQITVKTDSDATFCIIEVKDSGIGIAEEKLPFIFDRFYQIDNSTTRKSEGTGIGLALTKELIQLMNGMISVQSQWAKGTTFTVQLPITRKAPFNNPRTLENLPGLDTQLLPSEEILPSPEESVLVLESEQPLLLIVEDNEDVVTYMCSLLQNDYQILVAQNGAIGIEKALESIPDIIISDVMMPEKDGFEVVETLKTDERTNHIPIILLTAKATQEDKVQGLKHGADAYLMKPFDREELLVRLEKLLELRQKLQQRYSQKETIEAVPAEDPFLQKIRALVESDWTQDHSVEELAAAIHLTRTQLYRKVKALTGESPTLFIRRIRLDHALHLLQTTDLSIAEVAYDVGFSDPAYFSRAFTQEFGHPPSQINT